MSSKDSTGDKLVASIRKTRNSTAGRKTTPKKAPVAKKRTASSKKKVAALTKQESPNRQLKKQLVDLFQAGRRVWPD